MTFCFVNPHKDTDARRIDVWRILEPNFFFFFLFRLVPICFLFLHQRTNKDTVQCVKIQLEGRMWNSMSLSKRGRQWCSSDRTGLKSFCSAVWLRGWKHVSADIAESILDSQKWAFFFIYFTQDQSNELDKTHWLYSHNAKWKIPHRVFFLFFF